MKKTKLCEPWYINMELIEQALVEFHKAFCLEGEGWELFSC
jgi:hypothetical protein